MDRSCRPVFGMNVSKQNLAETHTIQRYHGMINLTSMSAVNNGLARRKGCAQHTLQTMWPAPKSDRRWQQSFKRYITCSNHMQSEQVSSVLTIEKCYKLAAQQNPKVRNVMLLRTSNGPSSKFCIRGDYVNRRHNNLFNKSTLFMTCWTDWTAVKV